VNPGRTLRWRSLRVRVSALVAVVALAPLLFVWISDLSDREAGSLMRRRVDGAAAIVATRPAAAAEIAAQKSVRVRVLSPQGVLADHDHEGPRGIVSGFGAVFFGPDGAPSLREWDDAEPPAPTRALVTAAREGTPQSLCHAVDEGRLLVCEAAVRVQGSADVVLVQESSRRAIRALYDLRYQLAKLVLFSLATGLALAWWLGWRLVRPVETLRDQVQQRTRDGSTARVVLARDDEIGDLAVAFNGLLGALEDRRRENEQFATDLAHELKNPIAAVQTASELLRGPMDAARAARIERILADAGGRLDQLVGQFLELARAEGGLVAVEREEIELGALARALVERIAPRAEGVEFEVTGEGRVTAAAERLETAVRNLLENAVAFARESPSPRVVVEVRREGAEVHLGVADNGPGIATEDLPRVFERFFSRRRHGGTGLGLPLARAIAEAHGGRLTASNRPEGGARLELSLPAS
jgi:signal transduction histidine kinase